VVGRTEHGSHPDSKPSTLVAIVIPQIEKSLFISSMQNLLMPRLVATILFLFYCHFSLSGQIPKYNQLLDTATKHLGLFVEVKPSVNRHLQIGDTTNYIESIREYSNSNIDVKTIIEIIQNSKYPDTTNWTDTEIKNSILVRDREEYIPFKKVIAKFELTDKKKTRLCRGQINDFNNSSAWDKDIFYLSRPIFDNSKSYAVIYYDNGHSGLGGGGGVTLFYFSNDNWRQLGNIARWNY